MIVTLVVDTFGINNNGTTISAMRFAESLTERGIRSVSLRVGIQLMVE